MKSNSAITPESAALSVRAKQTKQINNLTIEQIAHEAGLGYLAVQRQLSGKYNIDVRVLLTIARLCPNISAEWLLRGNGDILVGGNTGTGIEERVARLENLLKTNN